MYIIQYVSRGFIQAFKSPTLLLASASPALYSEVFINVGSTILLIELLVKRVMLLSQAKRIPQFTQKGSLGLE